MGHHSKEPVHHNNREQITQLHRATGMLRQRLAIKHSHKAAHHIQCNKDTIQRQPINRIQGNPAMGILVIHLIRLTLMLMLLIHLTQVTLATRRMWYRSQSGMATSSA